MKIDLDAFTRAYLICALWSSTGDDDRPLDDDHDIDDIDPDCITEAVADCAAFQRDNAADLEAQGGDAERNGHDFWLTRNSHGAGYWDRGTGEVGERLSKAAKVYGEAYLYVGDSGMVHIG